MASSTIETGLARLCSEGPRAASLSGRPRVGLLAHQASVDGQARHAIDLLQQDPRFELVRLFAPEHGLWGHAQDMESVADTTDPVSGLPVVSLYGDSPDSLRPHPAALAGLDAVICDLQDVGTRFYTFVYTIAFMLEAAAPAGLPVVVTDRPNPIGGTLLEGPLLRSEMSSFVGRYPIPVRHGMTAGELARMFNGAFGIEAELRVVEMNGWAREMPFDRCALPWIAPSPNMPTPSTAALYPGGCLVEGTNLSEGRGTTQPFELIGAPWLDGRALAEEMNRRQLPGVVFRAASFRPMFQKHAGQACSGVQPIVTEANELRPFRLFLELIDAARALDRDSFDWRREPYEFESDRLAIDLLLGDASIRRRWEQGATPAQLEAGWQEELERFRRDRERYLLY